MPWCRGISIFGCKDTHFVCADRKIIINVDCVTQNNVVSLHPNLEIQSIYEK